MSDRDPFDPVARRIEREEWQTVELDERRHALITYGWGPLQLRLLAISNAWAPSRDPVLPARRK